MQKLSQIFYTIHFFMNFCIAKNALFLAIIIKSYKLLKYTKPNSILTTILIN